MGKIKLAEMVLKQARDVYFTKESDGISDNKNTDYKRDFAISIAHILEEKYNIFVPTIPKLLKITGDNTMTVKFKHKNNNYDITLRKPTKYLGEWEGIVKVNGRSFKFPFSNQDLYDFRNILRDKLQRVERLLRSYDFYYQYGEGSDYRRGKQTNQYVIDTIKKLDVSNQDLLRLIKKVFKPQQIKQMRTVLGV